ncbi:N-carbamoyl-L-amino acid amidohydrolase [Anderseniella sp. Alg231-50]|uniref:N-carbamoyl-L-amino acid amidohydrolase n=1 Tax=Anderseniella sp. Alg231-50 TaxID=1922226 RepID=UPI000D54C700
MTLRNPYLKAGRLADVIAAITALGNYPYYKLSFDKWAEKIVNDPGQAGKWQAVFAEHPEFFRISGDKASLVWRRQFRKLFHTKHMGEVTREEFDAMSQEEKERISRRPLSSGELGTLIETTVNLHQRALEQKVASRYWIPLATASLAFLGSLVGGLIVS